MSGIGQEIRRLRGERNWTQAQLAVYAGSSQPTVNQIESGRRNPSTRTVEKLAEALGVEVADLFPKGQAPLPFEDRPSLEEIHAAVGCKTAWLVMPEADLLEAYKAPTPEEARQRAIEIGREVQDEYELVRPEIMAAIQVERELEPRTPTHRLPSSLVHSSAFRRYLDACEAARKALEETHAPTDRESFAPSMQPAEPEFPSEDPGPGARWERYGIGYIRVFEGMSDEEVERLRDGANEELQRRSHA
jgi:transcriptional regulator with XRE-family HTH domain